MKERDSTIQTIRNRYKELADRKENYLRCLRSVRAWRSKRITAQEVDRLEDSSQVIRIIFNQDLLEVLMGPQMMKWDVPPQTVVLNDTKQESPGLIPALCQEEPEMNREQIQALRVRKLRSPVIDLGNCSDDVLACFGKQLKKLRGPLFDNLKLYYQNWSQSCLPATPMPGCTHCHKYQRQEVPEFLSQFKQFLQGKIKNLENII
ncbi:uncharacterized protein [Heterodontus francisci]|uniref:uncharacterized protein isoform X2 n=1 Tax=Heterodontus francisci TaxID=7792 RepID=UPI00355B7645